MGLLLYPIFHRPHPQKEVKPYQIRYIKIFLVEFSDEDNCFVDHIAGLNDIISFHGNSVSELRTAFEVSVDDYIETCKKIGKLPQKSYAGHIMLRVPPELHAKAAMLAETHGQSLNAWVTELLVHAN